MKGPRGSGNNKNDGLPVKRSTIAVEIPGPLNRGLTSDPLRIDTLGLTDLNKHADGQDPYYDQGVDRRAFEKGMLDHGPVPPWAVLVITRNDLNDLRKEYTIAKSMGFRNFQIRFDHLGPTKGPESRARFGVYITQISTLTRSNSIASLPAERHGGIMSDAKLPESSRLEFLSMIATKGFQWIELEEDIAVDDLKAISRMARSSGTPVMLSSYPKYISEWSSPGPELLEMCEGYKINIRITNGQELKDAIRMGRDLKKTIPGKIIVIRAVPPSQREFGSLCYHIGSDLAFLESGDPGYTMVGKDPIKEKFQLESRIWRSLNTMKGKGSKGWTAERISISPETALCIRIGKSDIRTRRVDHFNELVKRGSQDSLMIPWDLDQDGLLHFFYLARKFDIKGISIGVPYTTSAMSGMDWLDPSSEKVGAINLAVGREGKFYGYNTEVYGIADVLSREMKAAGGKALVVGTGASGRAAALACSLLRRETYIAGSDMIRTSKIAVSMGSGINPVNLQSLERSRTYFDIIINTIPFDQQNNNMGTVLLSADLVRKIEPVIGLDLTTFDSWTPFLSSVESRGGLPVQGKHVSVFSLVRDHELVLGMKPDPMLVEKIIIGG
ncbi:MAG: shikimate dehydrogenase family protein [Thermoplasmatota archaeon]